MKITTFIASVALAGFLSTGAFAASTSTATTTAPAASMATAKPMKKATKVMSPEKTAISKQCSTLADAKGLHGKAREKFRSDCKKNGGKAPS